MIWRVSPFSDNCRLSAVVPTFLSLSQPDRPHRKARHPSASRMEPTPPQRANVSVSIQYMTSLCSTNGSVEAPPTGIQSNTIFLNKLLFSDIDMASLYSARANKLPRLLYSRCCTNRQRGLCGHYQRDRGHQHSGCHLPKDRFYILHLSKFMFEAIRGLRGHFATYQNRARLVISILHNNNNFFYL